jgi:hypothetical protein
MPWLARVTFRFPPPDSWVSPQGIEWRQATKPNAVRRAKRELVKGSVSAVWEITVPFVTNARYYEKAFPPEWCDEEGSSEKVRWS